MWRIKAVYQYLIALPILLVATLLCALITLVSILWKNSSWLHAIQMVWARLFCWLMFIPVHVKGTEHIRPHQSYVFVANHQSNYDVFVIYGWLPVVFKWLLKKEIFRIPLIGPACRAAGHIAIDRSNIKDSMDGLQAIANQLSNGVSTVIFPEGTRSEDGQLGRFKRGAFMLAWNLNLPVIPIRLDGCYEVMNRHAKMVTSRPISMTILPEMDLHAYDSLEDAMAATRQAIMNAQ